MLSIATSVLARGEDRGGGGHPSTECVKDRVDHDDVPLGGEHVLNVC